MSRIPAVLLAVLFGAAVFLAPAALAAAPADIDKREVKLSYPQIYGLGSVGEQITRTLGDEIDGYLATINGKVNKDATEGFRLRKVQVDVSHSVTYNAGDLLSVTIKEWAYTGGAHPMSYLRAFTFDTRTGDRLALADIFRPDADYRARLNAAMGAQIAERKIPVFSFTPFAGVKDNQEFYLTADGLVVYYQLYAYTPYVFGFLEFPIPYAQLADLLKPGLIPPAE